MPVRIYNVCFIQVAAFLAIILFVAVFRAGSSLQTFRICMRFAAFNFRATRIYTSKPMFCRRLRPFRCKSMSQRLPVFKGIATHFITTGTRFVIDCPVCTRCLFAYVYRFRSFRPNMSERRADNSLRILLVTMVALCCFRAVFRAGRIVIKNILRKAMRQKSAVILRTDVAYRRLCTGRFPSAMFGK